MKIDADGNSPFHWALQHDKFPSGTVPHIELDGKELRYVIEADDIEGYAIVSLTDEYGKFILDGDCFKTKRIEGKVVILAQAHS